MSSWIFSQILKTLVLQNTWEQLFLEITQMELSYETKCMKAGEKVSHIGCNNKVTTSFHENGLMAHSQVWDNFWQLKAL